MEFQKINLHQKKYQSKSGYIKTAILILVLIFLIAGGLFVWKVMSATSSSFKFEFWSNPIKTTEDRVNILMLGNAGGKHDGATLTDSIIVASYNTKSKKAVLISIPRDLWVQDAQAKVNTLYQKGETKDKKGMEYARAHIGEIIGIPIHYGVRLDFSGFARAVDLVGGVEVDVPKTFDDYMYPIEGKENDTCSFQEKEIEFDENQAKELNIEKGKRKVWIDPAGKIATDSAAVKFDCRYEHISYKKGLTQMNGDEALKFVRSRMGTNGEGSDFARSRRQQLVIQAFRQKALSIETLANPAKVGGLLTTFGNSFETDIPAERFLDFYKLVKDMDEVKSIVLGDLGDGKSLFINPSPADYGGAWVLIPPENDFSTVKNLIANILEGKDVSIAPSGSPINSPKASSASNK